ncbi:MAG: radical SAM protein [Proteobacteria bacterium]|nr:radical SAM protein [Pseudomonadota bacterium]
MSLTPAPPRVASSLLGWAEPTLADSQRFAPAEVFAAGLRHHHLANTAYPIAHAQTWRPYRVARSAVEATTRHAFAGSDALCLYVHVPFCVRRCAFCAYTVVEREAATAGALGYADEVVQELELYASLLDMPSRRLHGFDLGGGTPTLLEPAAIGRLLSAVHRHFRWAPGADISIETTPRLAARAPERLVALRALGIDRISMGIQVAQPALLRTLRREAGGPDDQRRAVEHVRLAGFKRLNVDLMYGFAGQSLASWQATLAHAIALGPEAITLYRMRYKQTRLAAQASRVTLGQIQQQQQLATQLLLPAGYHAPPGKTTYSRLPGETGTSAYLTQRVVAGMPYLGLGLGAQTLSPSTLAYNAGAANKRLAPYQRALAARRLPIQDLYHLPRRQLMAKMCAVSFYFGAIDRAAFLSKFGEPLERVFADEVAFLVARGLMELNPQALALTPAGVAQLNGVIALFYAPSVQAHLLDLDAAVAGSAPSQPSQRVGRHARRPALRLARTASRSPPRPSPPQRLP